MSYSQLDGQDSTQISGQSEMTSLQAPPKNVIYGEYQVLYLNATYERLFQLNRMTQFAAGAGAGLGMGLGGYGEYPFIFYLKPALLVGGSKHNLEVSTYITPQRRSWGMLSPQIGYRHTTPNGFTFRIGGVLIMQFEKVKEYDGYDQWMDIFPLPYIAFGKSF